MEDLYQYSHARLVLEQKAFRGTFMGSSNAAGDIPRLVRYFQEGRTPVDRLISDALPLDGVNKSLDLLVAGAVTREVLLPHA
jgi:Zn-dependent alcohol dehydrogenase